MHDPALKADYEKEQAVKDHFYDLDVRLCSFHWKYELLNIRKTFRQAFEALDYFLVDTDRRIEIARKKQDEVQEFDISEEARAIVSFANLDIYLY